jgi:hypothetical protein
LNPAKRKQAKKKSPVWDRALGRLLDCGGVSFYFYPIDALSCHGRSARLRIHSSCIR